VRANRTGLAVIVLTGAAAFGQGTMTFSWTTADTGNGDAVLQPGESAVLTLWAGMEPEVVGFAGSIFDIVGNADWQLGTISGYENLVDSLDTGPGTLHGDNSITGSRAFSCPRSSTPSSATTTRWRSTGWSGRRRSTRCTGSSSPAPTTCTGRSTPIASALRRSTSSRCSVGGSRSCRGRAGWRFWAWPRWQASAAADSCGLAACRTHPGGVPSCSRVWSEATRPEKTIQGCAPREGCSCPCRGAGSRRPRRGR
jgi:hypothetical protein